MRRMTILGGHRDGKVVDWQGYELRVALPRSPGYVPEGVAGRLPANGVRDEHFKAQQDLDGRWFYVLQPAAR